MWWVIYTTNTAVVIFRFARTINTRFSELSTNCVRFESNGFAAVKATGVDTVHLYYVQHPKHSLRSAVSRTVRDVIERA